jgi:flagellar hook protein FlgE
MHRIIVSTLTVFLGVIQTNFAETRLVPQEYDNIQAAINDCVDGDIVMVADGVYTGQGNRDIDLHGKAIVVKSENGPECCTIDCGGNDNDFHRGFRLQGGEDEASVIDGFTITNGHAPTGGGIYCVRSQPTIQNCKIISNKAEFIKHLPHQPFPKKLTGPITNFSKLQIQNITPQQMDVEIKRGLPIGPFKPPLPIPPLPIPPLPIPPLPIPQIPIGYGGGIYMGSGGRVINCVIAGNSSTYGGGIYCSEDTIIKHCTITGNRAKNHGGGVYCTLHRALHTGEQRKVTDSKIINSILWGNYAEYGPQLALESDRMYVPGPIFSLNGRLSNSNPHGQVKPVLMPTIVTTGRDFDLAINGEGYFTLYDGQKYVYTRYGNFGLDTEGYLVDPDTNWRVQRIGTTGEEYGWQVPGDENLLIDYNRTMPPNPTSEILLRGNLRSSAETLYATRNKITSNKAFTTAGGTISVEGPEYIIELDQFTGNIAGTEAKVSLTGIDRSGNEVHGSVIITESTTLNDLALGISNIFPKATAFVNVDGQIVLVDDQAGYSRTQITSLKYVPSSLGNDHFDLPTYFYLNTPGANDNKVFTITIYDSIGEHRVLRGCFVKTDTVNIWDIIIQSVTGEKDGSWTEYDIFNRRVEGVSFGTDGSYRNVMFPGQLTFDVIFEDIPSVIQSITLVLGESGTFTGLTQFCSATSSATAVMQNGYGPGQFAKFDFNSDGDVIFTFSNGVYKAAGTVGLSVFPNPDYLEDIGDRFHLPTSTSGQPVFTHPTKQLAGSITSKSLEEYIPYISPDPSLIVDFSYIEAAVAGISFTNARALRALVWGGINMDNEPLFARCGFWDDNGSSEEIDDFWVDGDYHLLANSPCIDLAPDAGCYTDIDGRERPFDFPGIARYGKLQIYDLGAYEAAKAGQARVRLLPQALIYNGQGKNVIAGIRIRNIEADDVDKACPIIMRPGGSESLRHHVVNSRRSTHIIAIFDKHAVFESLTEDLIAPEGPTEMRLGFLVRLKSGEYVYGEDTVSISLPQAKLTTISKAKNTKTMVASNL